MKTKLFILITLMLMCSACQWSCENLGLFCPKTPTNIPEFNIQEDINNAQTIMEESSNIINQTSKDITKEANNINKEATEVQNKIPEGSKKEIDPHLDSIKKSSNIIIKDTTKINKTTAKLSSAKSLLDNAEQKVIVTEGALDKITIERDNALTAQKKAEEDRDSQMQKMLQWLIISCIVGAGVCVVAFFMFGNKAGLIGAGACVLVLTLASFVQAYFVYLAIIGGCLLLLLLIALIWNVVVQKKAFSQVVETVEVAKTGLSKDKKEELFGKNGQTGIMDSIQNKNTINMVSKEKSKMPLWNIIKKKKED